MKVLLIVPAFNEEANILKTCKTIKDFSSELDYVVINDGSTDNTLKILKDNNLNHVNLVSNLGIGGAVQTGYKYAYEKEYDIAIQFDGDGQHDINYIANICEPILNKQANMVVGSRYLNPDICQFKSTFMRRFGSRVISFFIKILTGQKIKDPTSGFRAVDKKALEEFTKEYPTEYPEPVAIVQLLTNGYKVCEVPVSMHKREGGKSSIRLWKTADYMFKVVLSILIDKLNSKKRRK